MRGKKLTSRSYCFQTRDASSEPGSLPIHLMRHHRDAQLSDKSVGLPPPAHPFLDVHLSKNELATRPVEAVSNQLPVRRGRE
jgi:hypothetical protein